MAPEVDPASALAVDLTKLRAHVAGLAQQFADVGRRVGDVEQQLGDVAARTAEHDAIAGAVADLSDRVATLAENLTRKGQAGGEEGEEYQPVDPRPWAAVIIDKPADGGPPDAVRELAAWLETVLVPQYGEYLHLRREAPGTLPECWPRHRAAANELWTLYQQWDNAYRNPDTGPREGGDWHDRWLPGALERMVAVFVACRHYDPDLQGPPTA